MALSQQVEYSLREAQEALRNSLAFSARNEKPYVSKHIADMLANIENLRCCRDCGKNREPTAR